MNKPIQMALERGFEQQPASSGGPLAVDVRGVSLTFETSDGKVEALQGIDLEIAQHEFVSFIGPSGCGKTTLLRIIADLEPPTAGRAVVNGLSSEDARRRRDYGYIFQAPALYPWRSIEKNAMLPLEVMGLSRDEQPRRAQKYLGLVNLAGFERRQARSRRLRAHGRDAARRRLRPGDHEEAHRGLKPRGLRSDEVSAARLSASRAAR